MLKNPYPDPLPGSQDHKVTARIPQSEYAFLKRLIPYQFNVSDAILSTLAKKFLDELHRLDATGAFDNDPTGWNIESPTYLLVERVLSEFQRQPVGESIGRSSPRDDERTASRARETLRGAEKLSPESQGGDTGRHGRKETEEGEKG